MVYTSEKTQGQMYIPTVNWACACSHSLDHASRADSASVLPSNGHHHHCGRRIQEHHEPDQCIRVRIHTLFLDTILGPDSSYLPVSPFSFAVATVMLTTTLLISLQFKYVKGLPAVPGVMFFFTFGFFDGACSISACDHAPY